MTEYLQNPLVLVGLCAIVGGLLLIVTAWAFTGEYERGGRDSVHRRPRKPKPWHRTHTGELAALPQTKAPARHRLDTVREETTNLAAYVQPQASARSRVVMIGRDGLERGDYPGTTRRVRQVEKEHGEEEGGADRERREDEGGTFRYGEEGGAYAEAARPVTDSARWFRNTVTGEFVFIDEHGQRIDWDNGE